PSDAARVGGRGCSLCRYTRFRVARWREYRHSRACHGRLKVVSSIYEFIFWQSGNQANNLLSSRPKRRDPYAAAERAGTGYGSLVSKGGHRGEASNTKIRP